MFEGADLLSPPRPLVAVIIDDMGEHRQIGLKFLRLETNLSFSFLPFAPFTAELAEQAHREGHDVLVHLPMEPKDSTLHLEEQTLMVQDDPERIRRKTETMLAITPHALGANNHMGSRFCEHGEGMRVVIETLKSRSLFFVDSYTSPSSQGLTTARRLHLPASRRDLFLDNVKDAAAICAQLHVLAELARRQGQAIGIGHPHQAMLTALAECGPSAFRSIDLVGVHRLVR